MSTFTLDELRRILTAVAGADEEVDLSGDISGTAFEDLGYDSLALMEMGARISQEYGITMSDDAVAEFETPGDVVTAVDDALRSIGAQAS
jgi:minimal PKS acyl carrier protein